MNNIVLFGAGKTDIGHKALREIGPDRVSCFCDNDEEKCGTTVDGKEVVSFEDIETNQLDFNVQISCKF